MLPDTDVLSFKFGVTYSNVLDHRGFTHSLLFAFVVPIFRIMIGRQWFKTGLIRCWLFLDGFPALVQPTGFDNNRWESRRLALSVHFFTP